MSNRVICDLCGEPITGLDGDGYRRFKIKELKCCFSDIWWDKIDAHNECIKRLYDAAKQPKEDAK